MSEIRAATISDLAGTGPATLTKQSAAKSFVAFEQVGTQSIYDSQNISSITDAGVGVTNITLTNAMAISNYFIGTYNYVTGGGGAQHSNAVSHSLTPTSSVYRMISMSNVWNVADGNRLGGSTFGDLA